MKQVIVSIRDRAAQCFSRPVFTQTEGTAIRSFTDEVNRAVPDNELAKHPEDFDLYVIGVFDDEDGSVVCESVPRLVLKGIQAKLPEGF